MTSNSEISASVCVFGGTSVVGQTVISKLRKKYKKVICFSRNEIVQSCNDVEWRLIENFSEDKINYCIFIPPLWTLPEYFKLLETYCIKNIIVVSSTSLFTKENSKNDSDKNTSIKMKKTEKLIRKWALEKEISCTILRPTMIYGGKNNKNILEISKLIKKFGFFPIVGEASGLRQPIHYEDLSDACVMALEKQNNQFSEYNISGGEILTYKNMVRRVFQAMNRNPRFIKVPIFLFKFGIDCLRILPRFRYLTNGMIDRMNMDMVFDHSKATNDFGFKPRSFILEEKDIAL